MKTSLRLVEAAMVVAVLLTATVTRADAASFTEPHGSPIHVATDPQGHPQALTVAVAGYAPGALVYVEQCDGVDPNSHDWSATIDCDLGNSPAAVVVTHDGTATFDPSDVPHRFVPFAGASPQSLFNCVPAGDRAPANGLPSFPSCQVRVSTSPTLATPDQIFLALALLVWREHATAAGQLRHDSGETGRTHDDDPAARNEDVHDETSERGDV